MSGNASATVTVSHGTVQGHLPNNFVGFSFEKTNLTDGYFTASNAPLIALFKLLGKSTMRIGGNDVDQCTWSPSAQPVAGGTTTDNVGTADVDALQAFLNATGWNVIYGVNLKTATMSNSVAEAQYVTKTLGASLSSIEIGNEIDAYTTSNAVSMWDTFAKGIHAVIADAKLAGPADFESASFAKSFAATESGQVALLTHHHYRAAATESSATLANMLTIDPLIASVTQTLASAASSNKLSQGYRWGESNSYSHHGKNTVSNVFGAALFGIDYLLVAAENGAVGVNFHGGGENMDGNVCKSGASSCSKPFYYSPIAEEASKVTAAAPLYYGMLVVAHAGTGDMIKTASSLGQDVLSSYTISLADGSSNVVITNKQASAVTVSVDMGAAVTTASAKYLLGSSLSASTGGTFAGSAVSASGTWTPSAPYLLTSKGNTVTVPMPGASAVIVHVM